MKSNFNSLILFPDSAYYNKRIPKNSITNRVKVGKVIKEILVNNIDKITWLYKLSSSTINLVGREVNEIQVIKIECKTFKNVEKVLQLLDKQIPSQLLYMLVTDSQIKYAIAPKKLNKNSSISLGPYIFSNNIDINITVTIPIALSLDILYYKFITLISGIDIAINNSLSEIVSTMTKVNKIEIDINRLTKKMNSEKQFNKRFEINSQVKMLVNDLELQKRSLIGNKI